MLGQLLEGVAEVLLLLDSSVEFVDFSLFGITDSLVGLLLLLDLNQLMGVLLLASADFLLVLLLGFSSALHLGVVEQPLGQEINRVLGVSAVHDSHSLGNHETEVVSLEVFGVGGDLELLSDVVVL